MAARLTGNKELGPDAGRTGRAGVRESNHARRGEVEAANDFVGDALPPDTPAFLAGTRRVAALDAVVGHDAVLDTGGEKREAS